MTKTLKAMTLVIRKLKAMRLIQLVTCMNFAFDIHGILLCSEEGGKESKKKKEVKEEGESEVKEEKNGIFALKPLPFTLIDAS